MQIDVLTLLFSSSYQIYLYFSKSLTGIDTYYDGGAFFGSCDYDQGTFIMECALTGIDTCSL